MIVRLARQGGRDAVFDIPAQVLRAASPDPGIHVRLADDATVTATGRVREVSPQADPVTRTFQVKVGLNDPPEANFADTVRRVYTGNGQVYTLYVLYYFIGLYAACGGFGQV
jgi:multidrug efflux pump subunit AcrA (membrane-fusion protein)